MIVEIAPPYPLERFGEERVTYKLSSVGVWIIVSEEGSPKYYMAVQQADEPGLPWGIPAGKVSDVDQGFRSVGMREVQEETGLELNRDELRYLHWGWKHDGAETGYLIYAAEVDIGRIKGNRVQCLEDGTILYSPPADVNRQEISLLALIPLELAFQHNLLNDHTYHAAETYRGLTALRAAGYINGSFKFEEDPGL